MPLQNRVSPFGEIVATAHRGHFTGNRGIIHDPATKTLLNRRWSSKAWITCVCEFRGRRRKVMSRRSWTELFFLDEATAFAAGHRPCFECRRRDAVRFAQLWGRVHGAGEAPSAPQMDRVLHGERLTMDGGKATWAARVGDLPPGTMVKPRDDAGETFYLVHASGLLLWSFDGYATATDLPADTRVAVLTPPSIVALFSAGYVPMLHASADTHSSAR